MSQWPFMKFFHRIEKTYSTVTCLLSLFLLITEITFEFEVRGSWKIYCRCTFQVDVLWIATERLMEFSHLSINIPRDWYSVVVDWSTSVKWLVAICLTEIPTRYCCTSEMWIRCSLLPASVQSQRDHGSRKDHVTFGWIEENHKVMYQKCGV